MGEYTPAAVRRYNLIRSGNETSSESPRPRCARATARTDEVERVPPTLSSRKMLSIKWMAAITETKGKATREGGAAGQRGESKNLICEGRVGAQINFNRRH